MKALLNKIPQHPDTNWVAQRMGNQGGGYSYKGYSRALHIKFIGGKMPLTIAWYNLILWLRMFKRNHISTSKIYAILILALGAIPMLIDHDGTMFVVCLIFAVPLFFGKWNL